MVALTSSFRYCKTISKATNYRSIVTINYRLIDTGVLDIFTICAVPSALNPEVDSQLQFYILKFVNVFDSSTVYSQWKISYATICTVNSGTVWAKGWSSPSWVVSFVLQHSGEKCKIRVVLDAKTSWNHIKVIVTLTWLEVCTFKVHLKYCKRGLTTFVLLSWHYWTVFNDNAAYVKWVVYYHHRDNLV